MLELCKDEEVIKLFSFYKIDVKKISDDLQHFIDKKLKDIIVKDNSRPTPSASFERVLKRAAQHVQSSGKREVKALNILVAMYSERDNFAVFFLEKQKLSRLKVVSYISHRKENKSEIEFSVVTDNEESEEKQNSKSILETYCVNLNNKAMDNKIDPIIGRKLKLKELYKFCVEDLKTIPYL